MPVAGGALLGVAWWLLAPTAPVQVVSRTGAAEPLVVSPASPELAAAQDGALALLALGAGLVTGLVLAARPGPRPGASTALAGLGALVGSVLAVGLGRLLGPGSIAAQGGADPAGAGGSLTSPLELHAPGVLLVWPLVTLAVAALGHALAARLTPVVPLERAGEPPPPTSAAPGPPGPAPRPDRGDRR